MKEETDLGVTDLPLAVEVQERIARWLVDPRYADLRPALVEQVRAARGGDPAALTELADAFSQILPNGTGGRRGKVAPGPNRFNTVVLRETAQGIADALHAAGDPPKVAIVYDTRRDSRAFSRVVAETLVANRIDVILVDAPRPTPELSFLVRHAGCGAGVVISASHNPPADNGIKIYGPDGAQVLGARDAALMQAILRAGAPAGEPDRIPASGPVDGASGPADGASGRLEILEGPAIAAEVDAPYHAYVAAQGVVDDDLSAIHLPIAFTPLHGVGHTSVIPVLRSRGFQVEALPAQVDPDDGNFSTVASANPELPESMTLVKAFAREIGAELVIATDPDADRIGACAVASGDPGAEFIAIDGNRLGVLMLYHILRHRRPPPRGWILTTLVTSPLIASLAWAAGVEIVDDLLVGFKHHAGMIAEAPERPLVFGCEESHGYMRGNGIRDKDGAIAALLLSECAAVAKRAGKRLFDVLAEIWCAHGYHRERTANLIAPGLAGRQAIAAVMDAWRAAPPPAFAGLEVLRVEDRAQPRSTGSPTRDLPGNVLVFELAAGARACRLVLRPSGTEPKLKIYALARAEGSCTAAELPGIIAEVDALTDRVLADAETAARAVMAPVLEA